MNNTSEKLIHISMRTFSEMGYYGTSLNNIANELGIKKASLYNYFKSKDELYEQCIENCMSEGLRIIEGIDSQPVNVYDELSSFFYNYIYDSDYLVKFYVQLSFAPSNFTEMILEHNKELAIVFNSKLVDIHKNSEFNINREDFILFINMFVYGWLYRKSFVQNNVTPENIIKEFDQHIKILMNQSNADNS